MAQYDEPSITNDVNKLFQDREDLSPGVKDAIERLLEETETLPPGTNPLGGSVVVAGATANINPATGQPEFSFQQPPPDPVTGEPVPVQVVLLDLTGLTGQVTPGTKVQVTLPENMREAKVVTLDSDVDIEIVFNTVERVITSGRGNDSITVNGDANTTLESATGNDTLTTSGGDDSIISRSGDDSISSGAGSDTIVTHAGNDTIDAGTGYDLLQIMGSRTDYTVDIVDGSLLISNGTHTATVINADYILFDDGFITFADGSTMTVSGSAEAATIMRFYDTLLGRSAEFEGAKYWTEVFQTWQPTTMQMAQVFLESAEWQSLNADGLDNADYVELLYQRALSRDSDATGKDYWVNRLEEGAGRDELAVVFVESEEAVSVHSGSVLYIDGWV